jgi:hypothetical protein
MNQKKCGLLQGRDITMLIYKQSNLLNPRWLNWHMVVEAMTTSINVLMFLGDYPQLYNPWEMCRFCEV